MSGVAKIDTAKVARIVTMMNPIIIDHDITAKDQAPKVTIDLERKSMLIEEILGASILTAVTLLSHVLPE